MGGDEGGAISDARELAKLLRMCIYVSSYVCVLCILLLYGRTAMPNI